MTFLWLPRHVRGPLLNAGAFSPLQVSAVSGWLRLAASTPVSAEYSSVVDVLNSNPAAQTDVDRRPETESSLNGLPCMLFDGTDTLVWPLNATINNRTDKLGFWFWFRPFIVVGNQRILSITVSNGASASKLIIAANNAQLDVNVFMTDATGRTGSKASAFAAETWTSIYVQYDSSRGGDPNLVVYLNGVVQTLTFANIGAGATLGALPQPTGNAIIGARNDSDTPTNPILDGGVLGPNIFTFSDNLTAGQIAAFQLFEAPT